MHDLTTMRFNNPAKNRIKFGIKQRVYRWVSYIAAHKSRAIIVPSEYVKDDIARVMRLNSRKITVTYEAGLSIEAEPEPIEELVDKQFIMYVGRPNPHKNLERLIEAYSLLKADKPELQLVLAGNATHCINIMPMRLRKKVLPMSISLDTLATDTPLAI